jgi:hypothetical protein
MFISPALKACVILEHMCVAMFAMVRILPTAPMDKSAFQLGILSIKTHFPYICSSKLILKWTNQI